MAEPDRPSWVANDGAYEVNGLLTARVVRDNGSATVALRGELDLGSAAALQHQLFELLDHSLRELALDLDDLEFIDSSGLSALNATRTHAESCGTDFVLVSVPRQARRVLELTEMWTLFTVRDLPTGAELDGEA